MVFSSCLSCFKKAVFIFNFLLWLLGCGLLAVGGWLLTEQDGGRYVEKVTSTTADPDTQHVISYSQVTDTNLTGTLAYLFLVFGAALVLVAVIGCCGAVRDSQCLLTTFMILLLVIFTVLMGIGVWSYLASKKVDMHTPRLYRMTNETLRESVRDYYSSEDSKAFMKGIQKKLECCGADNGIKDYSSKGSGSEPPCEMDTLNKPCSPLYFDYVAGHFEDFVRKRLSVVATLSIAFAVCLVVHMLCVLLLCCAVRERSRSVNV